MMEEVSLIIALQITSSKLRWKLSHSHLEFDVLRVLLDFDTLGVLPPRLQEEVLDLFDLARHSGGRWKINTERLDRLWAIS